METNEVHANAVHANVLQSGALHSLETLTEALLGELSHSLGSVSPEKAETFGRLLAPGCRVFCDATGRSRLQVSGFAMRLAQMGYEVQLVGEPTATAFRSGDILLAVSASGTTEMTVNHAKTARSLGGKVLAITTDPDASLAQAADEVILIDAASKKDSKGGTIQPMGSLFEQTVHLLLDMLVLQLMERYGISSGEMKKNHANLE